MGVRLARSRRGHALALIGLSGFLVSCTAVGLSPLGGTSRARAASERVEVMDNFDAPDLEHRFEEVATHISPAVVAISATEAPAPTDAVLHGDDISADKLAGILESVDRTVGTGFVVDPDGYIVTNDHVVAHAEQLWVTTDSHKVYPAIVVGSDPRADLAVLKVPATNLPVVRYADRPARRGQWTIAIGNPYGLAGAGQMAISVGIVSATNRSLPRLSGKEDRLYCELIQTTAQINPGNSGGPLFDLNGEVIGINTAVILPQKQTNGIGFAIPADAQARRIIENLKQGREVVYGYLGVKVVSPTSRERRDAGLSEECGARIETVEPNSPAAAAHLQVGDIITQIAGEAIRDADDFVRRIGWCPVSEAVKARIYHHGPRMLTLTLRPREAIPQSAAHDGQRFRWRGLLLGPIPARWDFGAGKRPESGVMIIGIDSASPFKSEGITAGSVITAIAGKPIHDLADLQRVVSDAPSTQCRLELTRPNTVVAAN